MIAIGYMLSVCAAAASLGVATSMLWFRRSQVASLIAMLVSVLPIIPWLAVATQVLPGLDSGDVFRRARMPTGTIESLDRRVRQSGPSAFVDGSLEYRCISPRPACSYSLREQNFFELQATKRNS